MRDVSPGQNASFASSEMEVLMKAMRINSFGHADQVHEDDVPKPEPKAGEILVRVHDASINPVDWKIREGKFPVKASMPMAMNQNWRVR